MKKNYVFFIILMSCGVAGSIFAGESSEHWESLARRLQIENEKAFFEAAARGDTATVELKRFSVYVDAADPSDMTALMLAAQNGHSGVVEFLFRAGAEVNAVRKDRVTALMLAAKNGHVDVVRFLLRVGAYENVLNETRWTALMLAAENGHVDVVKLLLSKNSSDFYVNEDSTSGVTALMLAAQNGHVDVVKLLLRAGASVNAVRKDDDVTALMLAAQNGHSEVVKLLLGAGAKVDAIKRGGWTALMIAAEHGHVTVVKLLLDRKTLDIRASYVNYVNEASSSGMTALMIAAQNGHVDVVKLLLRAGASVNAVRKDDDVTALMLAAQNGHSEVVKLLLGAGAKVDAIKRGGWTALMIAAENGHVEVVELLLLSKKSLDSRDFYVNEASTSGVTALMLAAEHGQSDVVKLLLDAKANVDAVNRGRWTALMIAVEHGHSDVVKLLLPKALIETGRGWKFEKIKGLFDRGLPPSVVDREDNTFLMAAAKAGDVASIEWLAHGVDVNAVNKKGETALDLAANPAVADELKRQGAFSLELAVNALSADEIDRVDPTRALLAFSSRKGVKAVRLAQEAIRLRADVCAKNAAGDTALTLAVKTDNVEMVKLLLDKMEWKVTKEGWRVGIEDAQSCLSLAEFRAVQSLAKDPEIQKLFAVKMSKIVAVFLDAARAGALETLVQLNHAGIPAGAVNYRGETALMWAAAAGQVGAVDWLLDEAKVVVDARDQDSNTALIAAVCYGAERPEFFVVIDRLKAHGADVNAADRHGQTALTCAAMLGKRQFVDTLLKIGADIEKADKFGMTPLMHAANWPQSEVVEQLIRAGAKVGAVDKSKRTALMYASKSGDKDAVELLMRAGANGGGSSH